MARTNEIVKKIGTLIDANVNDTDISISHRISLSSNGVFFDVVGKTSSYCGKIHQPKDKGSFLQSYA